MPNRVSKKDIGGFVKVCDAIINVYGAKALTDKLLEVLPSNKTSHDLIQSKIIDEVGEVYAIAPSLIISSKNKTVTAPNVLAVLMFHRHLALNQTEISIIFKVHQSVINKRISQFMKVKDNRPFNPRDEYAKLFDDEFMKKYAEVNNKIETYIRTLNK